MKREWWTSICFHLLVMVCLSLTYEASLAQEVPSNPSLPSVFLERQSIEQDASAFPLEWKPGDVTWECELTGYGQSSPVVWNGQIYVTSVDGASKERCLVTAINVKSGAVAWVYEEPAEVPAESSPMISRAAPTPACDSACVYVFFETGNVIALTHAGEVRWQRKLQAEFGPFKNKFGISSSLAQTEDQLFILLDHDASSSLLAINKEDGSQAWHVQRSNLGHSWTSPAVVSVEGRPLIVCSSLGSIDVYDPKDGALLASHKSVGGNSVATPIDFGEGRFLVSSLIRPADGPVEGATKSNLLARIVKHDNAYSVSIDWIAENARGAFCSPILHRQYCYWINPQGVLFCLDGASGQEHYAKRLSCGGCWASPLAIGERLYCFGRDGETVVVRIGSVYEELSSGNRVWDEATQDELAAASNTNATSGSATPRAGGAKPGVYSAIALGNGFVLRRGNIVYFIASSR